MAAIAALVVVVAIAPLFYYEVFALFVNLPFIAVVVAAIAATVVFGFDWNDSDLHFRLRGVCLLSLAGMVVLIGPFFLPPLAARDLVDGMPAKTISQIPDTTVVRYLPYEIAVQSMRNHAQDPRHQPGNVEPLFTGKTFLWTAPMEPNGLVNSFVGQTSGIEIVDSSGQAHPVRDPFTVGEGMALWRGISWQLHARNMLVWTDNPYYMQTSTGVLMEGTLAARPSNVCRMPGVPSPVSRRAAPIERRPARR